MAVLGDEHPGRVVGDGPGPDLPADRPEGWRHLAEHRDDIRRDNLSDSGIGESRW
jgi:hypothetical protein